jgi:hypothetical protein
LVILEFQCGKVLGRIPFLATSEKYASCCSVLAPTMSYKQHAK